MLSIDQLKQLPNISGVYKVVDVNKKVLYIGQAKNIHQRWNNGHHKLANIVSMCGSNAFIEWVELPGWLLNRAEHAAITFYKPILNKKNPPIV